MAFCTKEVVRVKLFDRAQRKEDEKTVLRFGATNRSAPLLRLAPYLACLALATLPARAQTGDPIGIILAGGDIAGCFQKDRKYKEVAELITKEVKDAKVPVAVLALGDLAYANRDSNDKIIPPVYAECFEDFKTTWGVHKGIMLPVPGNHEYSDDPTKAGVFKTYFDDRLKALSADFRKDPDDPKDSDGLFYSTRFAESTEPGKQQPGWLVIGLNAYATKTAATRQIAWVKGLMAANTPHCVLAFAHPFINSSGHHGRKEKPKAMTQKDMVPFFKILHDGAATVLVAGHDHNFEQFDRQDPKEKASETGVRSFVAGTGGAKLYTISKKKTYKLKKQHKNSQMFRDRTRGLLKIVLHGDGYTWSFLNIAGEPAIDVPVKKEGCNPARAPKP